MDMKKSLLVLLALGTFASCTKVVTKEQKANTTDNYMSEKSGAQIKEVVDGDVQLRFVSKKAFQEMVAAGSITKYSHAASAVDFSSLEKAQVETLSQDTGEQDDEGIYLSFPVDLLGQQNVFGGVITKVSDPKNELVGSLKLTDLPPIHVRTEMEMLDGDGFKIPAFTLKGCSRNCDEFSPQTPLIRFLIEGKDEERNEIIINLASIGNGLNLLDMMDPKGDYTKLKAIKSKVASFDYSLTTLVFDVESKFIPTDKEESDPTAPVTTVTTRWFLKLSSGFNPLFAPRTPVKEVGFFTTEHTKEPKIIRHSISNVTESKIKYYVKNVPVEYQGDVKAAINNWNAEFKSTIGRELLTYEFIPAGDPRNETIIAGDVRYNVIEWDLNNVASYGGLGPSIANQYTGEILASNTLIQGPKIIEMYTKWFEASEKARTLIAQGRDLQADKVMKKFATEARDLELKAKRAAFKVSFGKIPMTVHAQKPELHDPILKGLFELVPEGMTFKKYMSGYFQEMIQHELGHNLGLRHNFRGNLGSNESKTKGSVSRSVMEYLGRGYRYLNTIGKYDTMAIAYGYTGVAPKHADWFCTDENEASDAKSILVSSPECSKGDATPDPFSYWEGRLMRAIELMVAPQTTRAPLLTMAHIEDEVKDMAKAYAGYALAAEKTAHTWTNFFNKVDRPERKEDVKDYVMKSLTGRICSPEISEIIAAKESPEAMKITQESYDALVKTMTETMTKLGLLKEKETICK